jgi:acetolactate synthase-1/2/3 large subunit
MLEAFKQKERTVFVDIKTDSTENVFPMIPAGGAHCDMLLAGRDEMVSKDETDLNAV